MRILVTGAAGYIGNAVAETFRQAGHDVYGLIRSKEKGNALLRKEITPVIGDLNASSKIIKEIGELDILIHCAYDPTGAEAAETPLLEAIAARAPKLFIYTSGVWVLGNSGNEIISETTPCRPIDLVKWRRRQEEKLLGTSSPGTRTLILRPGCVYGEGGGGDGGLTSMWFASAKSGAVVYTGNGENRWAMVHVRDLARAYLLAAESDLTAIAINIVDNQRATVKEMALVCAAAAGIPNKVQSLTEEESHKRFGAFTQGLLIDQQVSNDYARKVINWSPEHKGFIDEVEKYYSSWLAYRS